MLGLNLGRYVKARFNIVCGTLLFFIVEPILIKRKKSYWEITQHISCGFIKEEEKNKRFIKWYKKKGENVKGE
jgi:hypothetical protein